MHIDVQIVNAFIDGATGGNPEPCRLCGLRSNSAPTGKRAQFEGLILDRVAGDQVIERWEHWDQMGMLQQLGIL